MYRAKAAGKARHVVFDQQMHEEAKARLETENDLRGAVERNELVLHYQPVVSLTTGELDGFEALVRWNHPRRGLLPPADFIPVCEEIGMIVPAGWWVLRTACRQLREWQDRFPQVPHLTMCVNLSARQLTVPDLVPTIDQIIRTARIDPSTLVLEITESVMIQDPDAVAETLRKLRGLGVRLYMDDFGTGYSSLSCLHRFPLNGLKIDRSFMQNAGERREYAAVVHAIVDLARNLGMKLVAEGIESAEQVALLQAMGCDYAQGYYFDRPRDAAAAGAYIRKLTTRTDAA
jgi:EAL domain-containing protein (putative c-di-GMP-specific phosphodiesterase class I)